MSSPGAEPYNMLTVLPKDHPWCTLSLCNMILKTFQRMRSKANLGSLFHYLILLKCRKLSLISKLNLGFFLLQINLISSQTDVPPPVRKENN